MKTKTENIVAGNPALREVRVFISSTFRDLEEIRHRLTIDTFPRLRRYCADLGVAFTEIDLRWGITDDEARTAQVLRVCLEEVERCIEYPPFFIGILGGRYGWIPEHADWASAATLDESIPGFAERHRGKSITELEIQFGVLERKDLISSAFFYFVGDEQDQEEQQKKLKEKIRHSGAAFRERIKSPEGLSNLLFSDLAKAIEYRYPRDTAPSRLEQMLAMQAIHSARLAEGYVASESSFQKLALEISSTRQCCLTGDSGSGKSSFLSAYCQRLSQLDPDRHVFIHHVGVAESKSRFDWMSTLFLWARYLGLSDLAVPEGRVEIQANLPSLLATLEMAGNVTIVLDAIEQLDENALLEGWFPFAHGKKIRWVVSTTSRDHVACFEKNGWRTLSVSPLEQVQVQEIIKKGLAKYRKQLPDEMLLLITHHPMATHPLFLKVLYEELRVHGKHETLRNCLDELLLSDSIEALFRRLLHRVAEDVGNHVPNLLALICIARHGASEPELRSALEIRPWDVQQTVLLTDPYLIKHRGLLAPFHEGLRRSLLAEQDSSSLKRRWCDYWKSAADPYRRFVEYPHALTMLQDWGALAIWVYGPETLAFAGEHHLIDTLASWHDAVKRETGVDPAPGVADLSQWSLAALKGLRELSYQTGKRDLEADALAAQHGKSGLRECQWLIENSLLHYRRGNQHEALSFARQAISQAGDARAILDARMNLIQMLAFGDSPQDAYSLANQIALEAGEILDTDKESEAFLCQYTSFACHFLDLNMQSYNSSIRAAELYAALDRRYDQGISLVNAGDGAWGNCDFNEANRCFKAALEMADRYRFPHLEDIAKICLANLRMSEGNMGEAITLYAAGIDLAEAIGQNWDSLYGRIYQALAHGRHEMSEFDLREMVDEASASGYLYLEDLARAHMVVLGFAARGDIEKLSASPFPGPRAYAFAYRTLHYGEDKELLMDLINSTEGIKGPVHYIFKAVRG